MAQQVQDVIDSVPMYHPLLLRKLLPVDDAVRIVSELASYHDILYVTRRSYAHRNLTISWLRQYGFPYPEQIAFCDNDAQKWLYAAQNADHSESIALVDSQARNMLRAYNQFEEIVPDAAAMLRGRLALLAFGTGTPPIGAYPFTIRALPSWVSLSAI